MGKLLRRLVYLFGRKREAELAEEMDFHREMKRQELSAQEFDNAVGAVQRQFGNVALAREESRAVWIPMWLDQLRQDLKYALRVFWRNPGFAATVILTLALGIGANTAIFSVVRTVLLTPLPYKDSDRIVRMLGTFPAEESPSQTPLRTGVILSVAEARELQSQARSVTHVGLGGGVILGLRGAEEGARLQGSRVSSEVFRMLDAQPLLGRVFDESDEVAGGETIVLLSHTMWQRHFGGDPQIIGRTLTFNTVLGPRRQMTHVVVGVMPPAFVFPNAETQFWMPYAVTAPARGALPRGAMVVRLADDVTIQAATAELGALVRNIRGYSARVTYEVARSRDALAAPVRPALMILTVAVGFVLLIACINVANLLLARTAVRRRELTVRAALGAGRGRIVRHLLTESVTLSLAGGIAGAFVAWGGVKVLRVLATTDTRMDLGIGRAFPRLDEIGLDVLAFAFIAAVALLCGLACGVAPALRSAESTPMDALRESASTTYSGFGSFRRNRGRAVLIVAEIAMAMMLLIGGGLLIHSFAKLMRVDPGYDVANVLTFQVSVPVDAYPDERLKAFAESLVARIREIPSVQAAGYANQLPMIALRDNAGGLHKTANASRKPPQPGPDARLVDGMRRTIVLRASADADAAKREVLSTIRQIDRSIVPGPMLTIDERLTRQMAPQQFGLVVLGALGSERWSSNQPSIRRHRGRTSASSTIRATAASFTGTSSSATGPACSGRRGVKSANSRRSRGRAATMATSRACRSSTCRPTSGSCRTSRIGSTPPLTAWSSVTNGRPRGRAPRRHQPIWVKLH